ncbi:MAG: UDP-3-O-acyl-N-acetylglucosamine deacetylase [Acetobacteraceae bacterium]|nr:UDP-3-O-acyl-N-acetylglucosamine deacetylase [Acetobacteraceae bacterium]
MDGFAPPLTARRRRLAAEIGCRGIGLHSGRTVAMTLRPAAPGAGIAFLRADIGALIPARFDHVVDTRLCTALATPERPEARVGTVEHVMAALAAAGVDDCLIELDGPEVPILDGSAEPFLFLIRCAGVVEHGLPRRTIEVLKPVRVTEGDGWAELLPNSEMAFDATVAIDFGETAIGRQDITLRVTAESFAAELANARTFTRAEDVARLRAAGLAQGGSLDNAVVVDGPLILNPGGLRHADEFVRHKLLDVVGDLALAGHPIAARFRGHRSGHGLNNRLLRALMADRSVWRLVPGHALAGATTVRLPVAAAAARD